MMDANDRLMQQVDRMTERADRDEQTARWNDQIGAYAKCPECGSPRLVREGLTIVSCRHCGAWSRS